MDRHNEGVAGDAVRTGPVAAAHESYAITICTGCGVLTEHDRDYGGPFPLDAGLCPRSPVCGAVAKVPDGDDRTNSFGAISCPGERTIRVVPA